jgi:hypothetical protein
MWDTMTYWRHRSPNRHCCCANTMNSWRAQDNNIIITNGTWQLNIKDDDKIRKATKKHQQQPTARRNKSNTTSIKVVTFCWRNNHSPTGFRFSLCLVCAIWFLVLSLLLIVPLLLRLVLRLLLTTTCTTTTSHQAYTTPRQRPTSRNKEASATQHKKELDEMVMTPWRRINESNNQPLFVLNYYLTMSRWWWNYELLKSATTQNAKHQGSSIFLMAWKNIQQQLNVFWTPISC